MGKRGPKPTWPWIASRIQAGESRAAIAAEFGVSRQRVSQVAITQGAKGQFMCFDWTPAAIEQLHAAWARGDATKKIGDDIGCGKNAVVGKVRRLGLPPRRSPIKRK